MPQLSRRSFLAATAATAAAAPADWVDLFNGTSLDGWRASESQTSWKAANGQLIADGPRSHLFYTGPVSGANFRNFELEVEAMTKPRANSGVYFHTAFADRGFPQQGFEVQVNNTATGEGAYLERKKTGSLYGIRNVYKQFVKDDEWFTLNIAVRGKRVEIRLNGMLLVDFVEPTPPVVAGGSERARFLHHGTFALQCHDPGSKAFYRRIRVRPLPDSQPSVAAPEVDATWRKILELGAKNYPMVDYHVHLKAGLDLEQALARSRRDGIFYGLAINCGKGFTVENDAGTRTFFENMKTQPCFVAMQAEGREWTRMFSRSAAAMFDYVFTDSMTFTDNRGRRMRTWIPAEVGTIADPQEFMETLVERATGIITNEPIDIYVNPTFLPAQISADYDTLWTDARMKKVVDALARNSVAMEINDVRKLPSKRFIEMAKAAGVKFSLGTNNAGPNDLKRSEYGLQMIEECKLTWQDFFVPRWSGTSGLDRKPSALSAG